LGCIDCGSDVAFKIDLAARREKESLEATAGIGVKFLVTITLLPHLPGTEPDAKAELFNFKFMQFTEERGPGSCSSWATRANMHC
jgi:hypothetical protein